MALLVERDNIGIFGRMNAGKSSVLNLLTQEKHSLTDPTPGTTADTRSVLMELHGLGPVKLMDTAGADEAGRLGKKKRERIVADLKECDLVLLIIDPAAGEYGTEQELLTAARDEDKQVLVLYNLFGPGDAGRIAEVLRAVPELTFFRTLNIRAVRKGDRRPLLDFILANYESKNRPKPLVPYLKRDRFYVLVIPMDAETPEGRYLRPQAMTQEYITRSWAYPVAFRLDLAGVRSRSGWDAERRRFLELLRTLGGSLHGVITDSQAMDVMHSWCPDTVTLTTFSIVMINYMSRGRLARFAEGIYTVRDLRPGDRVLIAEACNHSRIAEDIGMVQIPGYLRRRVPGIRIEHAFGRQFRETRQLRKYRLIIHCGACMITPQKLQARVRDLETTGVPFTNYGLMLSYMQGGVALERVLKPWGIQMAPELDTTVKKANRKRLARKELIR